MLKTIFKWLKTYQYVLLELRPESESEPTKKIPEPVKNGPALQH